MTPHEIKRMRADDFIAMDGRAAKMVVSVMLQLYKERRMDGDAMRDAAHTLNEALRQAFEFDPEDL